MSLTKGYRTWSDLVIDSALVVVGKAGQQRQVRDHLRGSLGVPATITTFAVEMLVFQRDGIQHHSVQVQQTGPVPPNVRVSDAWPLPVRGERYLLFLTPALRPEVYYPVGAYQGVYHITQDDQVQTVMPDDPSLRELAGGMRLPTVLAAIQSAPEGRHKKRSCLLQ